MVAVLFIVTFAISWLNAWVAGRDWVEARSQGGVARLMTWAGAAMSACGFMWCCVLVEASLIVGLGHLTMPGGFFSPANDSDPIKNMIVFQLTPHHVSILVELGHSLLRPFVVISGLLITIEWIWQTYRKRMPDIGVAGCNAVAQVHHMYEATQDMSGGSFSSTNDPRPSKSLIADLLLLLLIIAGLLGIIVLVPGVLVTAEVIQRTSRNRAASVDMLLGFLWLLLLSVAYGQSTQEVGPHLLCSVRRLRR